MHGAAWGSITGEIKAPFQWEMVKLAKHTLIALIIYVINASLAASAVCYFMSMSTYAQCLETLFSRDRAEHYILAG